MTEVANQSLLWELLGVSWPTHSCTDLQIWAGYPQRVQFYLLDTATYCELVLASGWFIYFLLASKVLISVDSLGLAK